MNIMKWLFGFLAVTIVAGIVFYLMQYIGVVTWLTPYVGVYSLPLVGGLTTAVMAIPGWAMAAEKMGQKVIKG